MNASNILKHTVTPRMMRKELGSNPNSLQKSHSCSSLKEDDKDKSSNHRKFKFDNSLTVHVRFDLLVSFQYSHLIFIFFRAHVQFQSSPPKVLMTSSLSRTVECPMAIARFRWPSTLLCKLKRRSKRRLLGPRWRHRWFPSGLTS